MVWGAPSRVTGLWGALIPLCHSPPLAGGTAQNSQRDLHPIGGDGRGRAWDPPEIAGREWGRLKHIIVHGAHFFLGWGWSGGHKRR